MKEFSLELFKKAIEDVFHKKQVESKRNYRIYIYGTQEQLDNYMKMFNQELIKASKRDL